MKKLIIASLSALVLAVGGSAAGVSAQAGFTATVAPDVVAPGGTVTVSVVGADEGEAVAVVIVDGGNGAGVIGADGTASIDVTAPIEPGPATGVVTIDVVDQGIAFTVLAEEAPVEPEEPEAPVEPEAPAAPAAPAAGDGTPQPTAVNTGDASSSSSNSMALFAAAAGLLALGGGAMAIRRRSVMS